jgi:hypothetical protein
VTAFDAFVDDASAAAPGSVPLHEAITGFSSRAVPEVGAFVVADTDVPLVRGFEAPLELAVTGGAGQIAGPAALCGRLGLHLVRASLALRDLDDLPGNARRVTAAVDDARAAGTLGDDTQVHVELPAAGSEAGWLAAADEVAAAGHRLRLPTRDADAATLLRWVDAALDRELAFTATGLRRAVPGDDRHGFLNLLVATGLLFDGLPGASTALEETDPEALLDRGVDLVRARRWFTSFGSDDVEASLHDLAAFTAELS